MSVLSFITARRGHSDGEPPAVVWAARELTGLTRQPIGRCARVGGLPLCQFAEMTGDAQDTKEYGDLARASRHLPRSSPRARALTGRPTLQVTLQQFWMDVLQAGCSPGLV